MGTRRAIRRLVAIRLMLKTWGELGKDVAERVSIRLEHEPTDKVKVIAIPQGVRLFVQTGKTLPATDKRSKRPEWRSAYVTDSRDTDKILDKLRKEK